ncbi:MAG: CHAD domain-containing protein [Desulfuromonadales bacterium]
MEVRSQRIDGVRLVLKGDHGPESLMEEWDVEFHQQQKRTVTFWDTFEWGLWFSGHVLHSCGTVYHLSTLDDGWLGEVVCEEESSNTLRFWGDFKTAAMRASLEGMLGLRALTALIEGSFDVRMCELRNEVGKIVCRLEWSSVSSGKRGEKELLHYCQIMPLLGYEGETTRVVKHLTLRGATTSGKGPLEALLRHAKLEPQKYTLKPSFGLTAETAAREAVGRIVRTIMKIADRNVPGILKDYDTEFLHDYRICLRKIRSVLSLVKEVYPAEETRRMRTILGDLARQTNRLRDLDVYLLAREEYCGLLPPELRPALKGMFEDYAAERKVVVRHTVAKLSAHATRQKLRKIEAYFSEENPHKPSTAADLPVGPLVFRCIYKRYRKICRIAAGIGAETPDETVHEVRIECKKLRYLLEFFSELIAKDDGAAMQKMLRRLQSRLGDFNDASVQQKSLLTYFEQGENGCDVALGVGGLVSVLYHRQQKTRTLIEQSLEEFCSGSTAAIFKRTFKRPILASVTDALPGIHQ